MISFAQVALSTAMAVGPVVGYVDQYFMIRRKRSSAGFNSATCAILLFANILRIFFWLGKRFDVTLLVQSIVMIVAQLILLEVVVRFRHDPSPGTLYSDVNANRSTSSISADADLLEEHRETSIEEPSTLSTGCQLPCWSWDHYMDYTNILLAFTTVIAFMYLFLGRYSAFIEVLGALSLGIESTLPLPQFLSNYVRRSTSGFSLLVLGSWFIGDSFKLFYFIYTLSPLQFIICGAIQLSIDTAIVVQFILFSTRFRKWLRTRNSNDLETEQDLFLSE